MNIEITRLPKHKSGYQRTWIDEAIKRHEKTLWIHFNFFRDLKTNIKIKIVNGFYGHCQNYPNGFYVVAELLDVVVIK